MYLITGANGQLGRCISALLPTDNTILTDVCASCEDGRKVEALDITNVVAVKDFVKINHIEIGKSTR